MASDILKSGVPESQIVLGFHPPDVRLLQNLQ
ncbi:element excision factor XisI family protein [Okeania sp. SIO2C9]